MRLKRLKKDAATATESPLADDGAGKSADLADAPQKPAESVKPKFWSRFFKKNAAKDVTPTKQPGAASEADADLGDSLPAEPRPGRAPLLNDYEELPEYEGVLTGTAGALALSDAQKRSAALLLLNETSALLVATDQYYGSAQHLSLAAQARHAGFTIVDERIINDDAILALIYQKEKRQLSSKGDENTKADSVQLFESIIADAIRERTTDVHMNFAEETSQVVFRIDGILRRYKAFPSEMLNEAAGVAYNKLAGETSRSHPAYNARLMQSCSILLENCAGRSLKLRYQSMQIEGGHKIVLRLLFTDDGDKAPLTLAQLGYAPSHRRLLELAARKTVGAIVVAGVTGSGKSTTLKSLLLMSPDRHMWQQYSVEDPAEYKLPGVAQVSVQRTADATAASASSSPFTAAMRVIMRGDPDEIMVGEVRDTETGSLLKTMVQSGHQVYTTVHAASAIEVIERMTSDEIGISRDTMASRNFISAIAYQRLIAVNCPHCKQSAEGNLDEAYLQLLETKFRISRKTITVAKPDGCTQCKGRGVKGQTVLAEILAPQGEVLKFIREGRDIEAEEAWRATRTVGFDHEDCTGKTAFEHGLYKVATGLVDPRVLEDSFEPLETYRVFDIEAVAHV
jgi:general secretion pathway protein E